jgi:hypothetical protein
MITNTARTIKFTVDDKECEYRSPIYHDPFVSSAWIRCKDQSGKEWRFKIDHPSVDEKVMIEDLKPKLNFK